MNYYVYVVFVDGKLKYIGKGKDKRYLHGISGTSRVFGLNEAYFQGKLMEVGILKDKMGEQEALLLETQLIVAYGSSEDVALFNYMNNTLNHETKPSLSERELYNECIAIRSAKYVKGEYARTRPSVYNDESVHPRYPL